MSRETLLTIFSAPKPFTNPHIALIQRNAIQSWLNLGPQVEVLLIGDENGMAQTAQEFSIQHLPQVARNKLGTPLVSSIFDLARNNSQSPVLMYTNGDMLYLPDLLATVKQVSAQAENYLMIGQRWDLDVRMALDFSSGWDRKLRDAVLSSGRLHQPAGSDYFIYPRECFSHIPEFAIGRAGWDNWMIYHARQQGWPTIDATHDVMAVHQDHDYSHLPGGKPHYDTNESEWNTALAGGKKNMYITLDSDKELINGMIHPAKPNLARIARRLELWIYPSEGKVSSTRRFFIRRLRRLRHKFYQVE